jgi:ABC-type nitrate/sulfonate/bicarbonate transport system ATPase subunit
LEFAYPGGPVILAGLDLRVEAGSSAAVMAPSGVGKSTLLMVVGGLRRPRAGHVDIVDDSGPGLGGRPRPRVAWVFQSMHLLTGRTAVDNVALRM